MESDSRIVFPHYWIEASVRLSGLPEGGRRHLGAVITRGKWNSRRNGLAAHDIGRAQRITMGSCRLGSMYVWKHYKRAGMVWHRCHSAARRYTHLAARRRTSCGVAAHSTYCTTCSTLPVYPSTVILYSYTCIMLVLSSSRSLEHMLKFECSPIYVFTLQNTRFVFINFCNTVIWSDHIIFDSDKWKIIKPQSLRCKIWRAVLTYVLMYIVSIIK